MRRNSVLTLVLITLFVLSLASPSDMDTATDTSLTDQSISEVGLLSEGETTYAGVGAALDVSFSGTFANLSSWTDTSSTLSNLLTPGVSYSVDNASAVTWTANVLVSPPVDVISLSFSVTYPVTDWKIVSVSDPVGVARTYPSEWFIDYDQVAVTTAAIDTHGVWKLTFTAANHLLDLEMGPSGGPYTSTTTTFDTGDTARFGVTSSWITGASAEFDLIEPTGSVWYSASNTTSGFTTHALPSFRYHKDITIHNAYVTGDLTDFPVLVDIIDADLHTNVQADGDDIVFYSNGVILSHEIELFEQDYSGTEAHLVAWVKANLSNSVDTIISMYYGNPEVGSQAQPKDVWTSNYSAVWHLGEAASNGGTSTDYLDSTGNGYYGDQSGTNDITGIFGVGQNFDGTDVIDVSSARGLEPSGDVSISGWFKLNSAINQNSGVTQVLLTKAIDGDTDMYVLIAGSDYSYGPIPQGSLVFKMENAGLGQKYVWSLRRSWLADTWYFFTCTMTASSPSLNKVFVNGADNTNTTYGSLATANLAFTADWEIGGGFVDQLIPTFGWFDGVIDEVRILNAIQTTAWIQTKWLMWQSSSSFRTITSESVQASPDMYIEKVLDLTAPAGLWTISAHYNDSGSTVSHRVGEYSRNFIVRRASTLAIDSPSDAAAGLETMTVGDLLYIVVDLSDTNNANPAIGATVSMNWTVSGSPTIVYFEDLGDGRYSVARNTSELSDRGRWRINIDSSHPYYFDASTFFDLDLYHPTQLNYEWVTTTPVGFIVNATLVYRDTWDGTLISGATITLGDGSSPFSVTPWTTGRYNVSIDTAALPKGVYSELFNASKSSDLYEMASSNVTYAIRAHYTAASVSGNLETPYGDDTIINIVLVDLDTGQQLDATVVDSLSFVSSYGTQSELSVSDLNGMTLTTNAWNVGITSVNLTVVMSDSDYYAPDLYSFDVEIRNHLTAVNIIGDLTTAYGANTSITVTLTDLDGGTIVIGSVTSFTFTSSQPVQVFNSPSSFSFDLDTNNWPVSTIVVTLQVVLSGNYDNPVNYVFSITIRSLQTTLYNGPSNLVFPQGSDFTIDVHFNVSEVGQYYQDPINGEAGQFVVTSSLTLSGTTVTPLGNGMYRIVIPWSNFNGQGTDFSINIDVTPSSNQYASASLVVSFQYRAIVSDLTANLYTVSTPYNMDVTIHLYYTDRDSSTGITTATISANPSIINSQLHIANGDYQVDLDVSSFGIGSHIVNLTASATGYDPKWVLITIVVTQIHTDANPSTIRLEIPSGNTAIFTIDWTDLDNSVPIFTTTYTHNWTGSVAPLFLWTGSQYQITFEAASTDVLGTYLVWFNFTNGANYQPGYCEIQIEIRSHSTILTADSPPPTAFNAIINITAYFYDFDNKVGIKDALVNFYVENVTGAVSSTFEYNLVLGDGFYTIHVPASQFGLGSQTFTVYVEWLGAIQQYENKNIIVSVNIAGVSSLLTLIAASDPSAYLSIMTYEFLYSEQDSGIGITNSTDQGYGTGHVYISISFDTTFNMLMATITEVNAVTDPGLYRIAIDTSGFDNIGQYTMTITIDWTGANPFYSTREDTVSVWVLARDTLLLVNPPSPESYGETATFSFSWQDTGTSTNILDSSELDVSMNITFGLVHNAGLFTITFNTNQFASVGTYVMILNVTWAGQPFYSNRTNRLVSITVLNRQTVLDYPTPDPTFYDDNVTITITWTDVTNGGSDGILGATIVVSDNNGVVPSNEYDIRSFAGGVYEIEFDTARFATTGVWNITIQMSSSITGIQDKVRFRNLDIRERRTILSYEAVGKVAYGDPIEFILYFDDLYTATIIGNGTGDVSLEILTPGTWVFTSTWNAVDEWYDIVITSYPPQSIGTPFDISFNMSYSNVAPFYASDDFTGSFQLRERLSLLSLEVAPNPTAYLDDAVFLVQFLDVDADAGISADYFEVYFGITQLTLGPNYTYTPLGGGFFELSVNSTVFPGIGLYGISVYAYWTSGVPYHNNASASVNIRVTTRPTIVDITVPPSQTPFLNNVSFAFEYTDLLGGNAITSILTTDISLYKNTTLVNSGDYSLTPSGNGFILTVDSEILGSGLGRYNLTIFIDWNQLSSPYYVDAQTTTWVSVIKRTLSFVLDPLDETPYGHYMNISFFLSDYTLGTPVDGAIITFSAQTMSLTLGVDYFITPLTGGNYLIAIDTTPFGAPGDFLFNLDIGWNPSTSPYYKSMKTIVLTGVISDIETELIANSYSVETNWGSTADLVVHYRDLIWSNAISDATVEWESSIFGVGVFDSEFPPLSGNYSVSIDTSAHDAGTYIISIRASKDNYETARAYITIIVLPLKSDIVPINPTLPVFLINRGAALNITILIEDTSHNPISNTYININGVQVTVEGGGTYILIYAGSPGYYTVVLPEDSDQATKRVPGSYAIVITASMRNYEPAAYSFSIQVLQTRTAVTLTGDTSIDMSRTYTENVTVYVHLILPDAADAPFWNATVAWSVVGTSASGSFTHLGNGNYSAIIPTTDIGFGIWNIIFKATPWANASLYAGSQTTISFAVTRIQTSSILPETRDFIWGWSGNLQFIYWDETFGKGIPGANVTIEIAGLENVILDVGNGTYLVFFNTSLLRASNLYIPLPISFSKLNYAPASATINIRVLEVPTDIFVDAVEYTPAYAGELINFEDLNIVNLEIPYGDSMAITFFYNDTDASDGFVGGLPGAIATLNSYLRGPSFDGYLNVSLIDLGDGLYQVIFNTLLPGMNGRVDTEFYRLNIQLGLENRSISEILFRIKIINVTTLLTVVNDIGTWNLVNGESLTIELLYMDTWHDTGITGVRFTANASRGAPFTATASEGSNPGQYFVTITASGIKLTPGSGTIMITIGDGVYTLGDHTLVIDVSQNGSDILIANSIVYGLPIGLILLLLGFAYVRVWNVPKRLRQINAQIKTIRKGKIPKPVMEAKSRSALVADLFNDTYAKLGITRTPEQMPEESVPVEVPELGELLIQLAILTNLDQKELDDFKADIAKMKMSEQAAFVKEVIIQEAIRAARRENKTVEEVLEDVGAQASKRLAGEGEGEETVDGVKPEEVESEVDTVILPDKERSVKDAKVRTFDDDGEPTDSKTPADRGDKLSQYEIEELKKDLEAKGVPLNEIDGIVKQAEELPRDLVEELIRSLDRKRGT